MDKVDNLFSLFATKDEIAYVINTYRHLKIIMQDSSPQNVIQSSNSFIQLTGTFEEQISRYKELYRDENKSYKVYKTGQGKRATGKSEIILYSFKQCCKSMNIPETYTSYSSDTFTHTLFSKCKRK